MSIAEDRMQVQIYVTGLVGVTITLLSLQVEVDPEDGGCTWLHQVAMAVKRNNCSFTTSSPFAVLILVAHLLLFFLPLDLSSTSSVGS